MTSNIQTEIHRTTRKSTVIAEDFKFPFTIRISTQKHPLESKRPEQYN